VNIRWVVFQEFIPLNSRVHPNLFFFGVSPEARDFRCKCQGSAESILFFVEGAGQFHSAREGAAIKRNAPTSEACHKERPTQGFDFED